MAFIVELEPGIWIAPWVGDPGLTLERKTAQRFTTKAMACLALANARRYRPFAVAKVKSATDRCRNKKGVRR